jgi:transposase-like protein
MTAPQSAAFWIWYNTGLRKSGKRSFKAAAKILGRNPDTLRKWAAEYGWEKKAEEADQEVETKLDELVIDAVIENADQVIKRQRHLIARFYGKIEKLLDDWEPSFSQMLELMRYEKSLDEDQGAGPGAGFSLAVLLQHAKPEVRSELHELNGRLRREGRLDLLGTGVGHPSSN